MDKKKDKLFLVTAIIEKHAINALAPLTDKLFPPHNEAKEAQARAAMTKYLAKAKSAGVADVSSVVAFAGNFGEFVQREAVQRKADMVVVGPHMAALGTYLRRNHINVLTAAGEVPIDTRELEEQERERRIAEQQDILRGEETNAATASKIAAHYTKFAEHEEQERRVRENTFREVADYAAREVVKRGVHRAQDAEQQERVAREHFSDAMADIERHGNIVEADKAEAIEQERRVNEGIHKDAANLAARAAMHKAVIAATERERMRRIESPTFKERCPKSTHMADFVGVSHQRPQTPVLF